MNKELFQKDISEKDITRWQCPHCQKGRLSFDKKIDSEIKYISIKHKLCWRYKLMAYTAELSKICNLSSLMYVMLQNMET